LLGVVIVLAFLGLVAPVVRFVVQSPIDPLGDVISKLSCF